MASRNDRSICEYDSGRSDPASPEAPRACPTVSAGLALFPPSTSPASLRIPRMLPNASQPRFVAPRPAPTPPSVDSPVVPLTTASARAPPARDMNRRRLGWFGPIPPPPPPRARVPCMSSARTSGGIAASVSGSTRSIDKLAASAKNDDRRSSCCGGGIRPLGDGRCRSTNPAGDGEGLASPAPKTMMSSATALDHRTVRLRSDECRSSSLPGVFIADFNRAPEGFPLPLLPGVLGSCGSRGG